MSMEKEEKLTYEQLMQYYDTSCGAWVIDRNPQEVDIEWIRKNAYQLTPIDNDFLCTDCRTCPLKEH